MTTDIDDLKEGIKDLSATVTMGFKDISDVLNGKDGLVTEVQLNKQSTKRLWWFVGALALTIVSSAAYIVRAGMI